MRRVAPRPCRTLADVLDTLATGALDQHGTPGVETIDRVRASLDDMAGRATAIGGWTEHDPLRLSKRLVAWLLRCPRRALADEGVSGTPDDLVAGLIVDAAAKLATLVPQRRPTVAAAVDFLAATGETVVTDHLAGIGPDAAGALLDGVGGRVERLLDGWPRIDPGWWPRVEEPVRARLAGGAVVVAGRLDLVLGGPPTGRPTVVVEVKAGRWYDGIRADGHLYALLVALRDGAAPAAVVTTVADGTTQVEPLRGSLLVHAAERLGEAAHVAARIAAGEPPAALPGWHCPHCPVRAGCEAGQAWQPDEAATA
jgi:hypothetical protein